MSKKQVKIAALIVIASFFFFGGWYFEYRQRRLNSLLTDSIHEMCKHHLQEIIINPERLSHENWEISVSDHNSLKTFKNALAMADDTQVSGHSGPIGEWSVTLKFDSGLNTIFAASIHEYEKEHLFLQEKIYKKLKDGSYIIETLGQSRLPYMAKWMTEHISNLHFARVEWYFLVFLTVRYN